MYRKMENSTNLSSPSSSLKDKELPNRNEVVKRHRYQRRNSVVKTMLYNPSTITVDPNQNPFANTNIKQRGTSFEQTSSTSCSSSTKPLCSTVQAVQTIFSKEAGDSSLVSSQSQIEEELRSIAPSKKRKLGGEVIEKNEDRQEKHQCTTKLGSHSERKSIRQLQQVASTKLSVENAVCNKPKRFKYSRVA